MLDQTRSRTNQTSFEGIGKVRHVHQLLTTATVEQETMQKPELSI